MEFPDFTAFVKQLDLKTVDKIAQPMVPIAQNLILYHPDDPEAAQKAQKLELQRTSALAFARSLALLRLYHDWLGQHIEND